MDEGIGSGVVQADGNGLGYGGVMSARVLVNGEARGFYLQVLQDVRGVGHSEPKHDTIGQHLLTTHVMRAKHVSLLLSAHRQDGLQ